MSSFTTIAWIAGVAVVAAAIIYGLSRRRRLPLGRQAREQTPRKIDDGHTA